ncbi:MAG: DUF1573 domain-containing protein [Planctomycetes bacterium]|nr:DUF1573 domain-containing protein [Planctomycetota bacterium]
MKRVTDRRVFLFLGVAAGLGSASLTYLAVRRGRPPESGLQARSAVCDVGRLRQGMVTAKFELVNQSLLPVRITHFVKSCRCAEINVPSRNISPSESVTVDCRWDTSGMRGKSRTTFVVVYTEADRAGLKKLPLAMRGEIIPEFDYSPTRIEFVEGKAATQRVSLVPRTSGGDIVVEKASCSHEALSITLPSQREIDVSFVSLLEVLPCCHEDLSILGCLLAARWPPNSAYCWFRWLWLSVRRRGPRASCVRMTTMANVTGRMKPSVRRTEP